MERSIRILGESCAASGLNQVPNLFGSEWHIDVPHAQVAERIHHRIDDGGRRTDGASLAYAFNAQRIHGRGRTRVGALNPWNHAGLGDGVIHQLAGDELAVVVVDGLFVEGLSEALHDAAVDLSIDQQRVDDVAAIVYGHIAQNLDLAGIAIHLRHYDVRAEGEREVGRLPEARGHQARFCIGRQLHGAICGPGYLGQPPALACATGSALAVGESHVARFEQQLTELHELLLQILESVVERRSADGRATAAEGSDAVLHDGSVAVQHHYVVERHAQFVGGDLGEGGLFALAVRRDAGHDSDCARWLDLDRSEERRVG